MIAACPKCDAKYRVDEAKVGAEGARLRCAKCKAVFRVRAPASDPGTTARRPAAPAISDPATTVSSPPAADPATTATSQAAAPVSALQTPAPSTGAQPLQPPTTPADYDPERLVLVADPSEDTGKGVASALAAWGLQTILVHDGVEAMLSIQRHLPKLVVLDAALPKMYGFQICEIVKRNDSLRDTKVILVGAIHNRERYRRPPTELYGADCYLEQPDLPDGLLPLLVQFGLPVTNAAAPAPAVPSSVAEPVTPAPAPLAAPPPPIVPQPTPPPAPASAQPTIEAPPTSPAPAPCADGPAADGMEEEREKAERLARIVVSDIILYQGEKFAEAIRTGNLLEALDSEIEEGRSFFRQRINEQVRSERDHIVEELMRVAHERGMQ
jgi:predicted Zn finger-like uncharacterized protein